VVAIEDTFRFTHMRAFVCSTSRILESTWSRLMWLHVLKIFVYNADTKLISDNSADSDIIRCKVSMRSKCAMKNKAITHDAFLILPYPLLNSMNTYFGCGVSFVSNWHYIAWQVVVSVVILIVVC